MTHSARPAPVVPTLAAAMPEIVLVRHGRTAHVERRWLDLDSLRSWMAAYDAAGIALRPPPPPALLALAAGAGALVSSDLPRALASAALLSAGRTVEPSPLLREAPPETPADPLPRLGGARLPLHGWALVFGARWLWASWREAPPPGVDAATLARADAAAEWLIERAGGAGRVVVVTHATFRTLVAAGLARRGWRCAERRPFHEWSAWRYRPAVA
jgi:broad specificity phosphatase PhoE